MFQEMLRFSGLLLTLTSIACTQAAREPQELQATPAQRVVLNTLVQTHPGWRLAQSTDNTKIPELRRAGVAPPQRPYFSSTGEHTDGSFAVALVKSDTFKVFYVPWASGTYATPIEVTTATWLNRGQLLLRGDTLEIGPLASDEIFTFVWDPNDARWCFSRSRTSHHQDTLNRPPTPPKTAHRGSSTSYDPAQNLTRR